MLAFARVLRAALRVLFAVCTRMMLALRATLLVVLGFCQFYCSFAAGAAVSQRRFRALMTQKPNNKKPAVVASLLKRSKSGGATVPADRFSANVQDKNMAPDLALGKAGCHPRCVWHCTDPVCDMTCEPVCKAPECETRCPQIDTSLCSSKCTDPDCAVVCPKKPKCESGSCPDKCNTVCGKPKCTVMCEAPPCHSICADPKCEWTCKEPEACPKPQCQMQCEQPKGCLTGQMVVPLPDVIDQLIRGQAAAKVDGVTPMDNPKPLEG